MINRYLRTGVSVILYLAASKIVCAGQASFRIVSYMDKYDQPAGLTEGSPGVFYGIAGVSSTAVAFSVTPQGSKSVLASFPSGYNIGSLFVAASNDRLYSSVQLSDSPASVFSITSTPGKKDYPAQNLNPTLTQSLPGGELLAVSTRLVKTVISYYLATVDLNGVVTAVTQFPSNELDPGTAIYASDGNYYGISQATNGTTGYVFRVTPSGSLTKLYDFPSGTFVGYLQVPLLQADDGNLYGAAPVAGTNGTGIIFKLTLDGQYTLLYTFPKNNNGYPSSLIEGSDGNLYGATIGNFSAGGVGQLFRITKSGQYTLLYEMSVPARDGACGCGLVLGSDGIIYGTAQGSGRAGAGAIFALDAGLPKPRPWAKKFGPQSGPAGTRVRIWGANLLSATVQFNGVPAVAVSSSGPNYVWATVPAGATTGPISVTTPGGSNTTQASFTVQ
jgi:uncharacterized repeat protein (TIGR03803 family)